MESQNNIDIISLIYEKYIASNKSKSSKRCLIRAIIKRIQPLLNKWADDFFETAKNDLALAEMVWENKNRYNIKGYANAVFALQQSSEKLCKAFSLRVGIIEDYVFEELELEKKKDKLEEQVKDWEKEVLEKIGEDYLIKELRHNAWKVFVQYSKKLLEEFKEQKDLESFINKLKDLLPEEKRQIVDELLKLERLTKLKKQLAILKQVEGNKQQAKNLSGVKDKQEDSSQSFSIDDLIKILDEIIEKIENFEKIENWVKPPSHKGKR